MQCSITLCWWLFSAGYNTSESSSLADTLLWQSCVLTIHPWNNTAEKISWSFCSILWLHKLICHIQQLTWVRTHGNAIPRPAISAIWRSHSLKEHFFLCECTFPGRNDSFIHENATSESEFGQDDINKHRGPAAKLKEAHRLLLGAQGFLPFPLP